MISELENELSGFLAVITSRLANIKSKIDEWRWERIKVGNKTWKIGIRLEDGKIEILIRERL